MAGGTQGVKQLINMSDIFQHRDLIFQEQGFGRAGARMGRGRVNGRAVDGHQRDALFSQNFGRCFREERRGGELVDACVEEQGLVTDQQIGRKSIAINGAGQRVAMLSFFEQIISTIDQDAGADQVFERNVADTLASRVDVQRSRQVAAHGSGQKPNGRLTYLQQVGSAFGHQR